MPDWAVTVGEREASFYESAVDLIEEAELHSICGIGPDGKVAAPLSEGRS